MFLPLSVRNRAFLHELLYRLGKRVRVSQAPGGGLRGAVGRLVAGVLFGLAEIEHEHRQERQAAGIAVAKRKGRYHGRMKGTTKAQPTRAWLLYDRGFTVVEIMQALQISRRTVYRYLATQEKA